MGTIISSRTPEGVPCHCPICGVRERVEPSDPAGDAPCPCCGSLLWPGARPSRARPTVEGWDNLRDQVFALKIRQALRDRVPAAYYPNHRARACRRGGMAYLAHLLGRPLSETMSLVTGRIRRGWRPKNAASSRERRANAASPPAGLWDSWLDA